MSDPVLNVLKDGYAMFWCPGCDEPHAVGLGDRPHAWGYNGDPDRPTLTPSVLVTSGHFAPGHDGKRCWCDHNREHPDDAGFTCIRCHSFITDGQIRFLSDCSHASAGLTLPLPPFPKDRL